MLIDLYNCFYENCLYNGFYVDCFLIIISMKRGVLRFVSMLF